MENFNQIFTLLAEEGSISLNLDILETGLLNILALFAILIYTGKDFLGSLLDERKTTIVKSIQDAEDRLNEAQKRLREAEKQLDQADLVMSEIKSEAIATKKKLLESDAYETKQDLKIRFERALVAFRSKEQKIFGSRIVNFGILGKGEAFQTQTVVTNLLDPRNEFDLGCPCWNAGIFGHS